MFRNKGDPFEIQDEESLEDNVEGEHGEERHGKKPACVMKSNNAIISKRSEQNSYQNSDILETCKT